MKAKLLPYNSKYYGTRIEIDFEDEGIEEELVLWDTTGFEPSVRELEHCDLKQEDWDDNVEIEHWGEKIKVQEADLIDGTHFESKLTYNRALKIIEKLND